MKFGVAVNILEKMIGDLDIPNKTDQIVKYLKDNPTDVQARVAWQTYSKGSKKSAKEEKNKKIMYYWTAIDVVTGKQYEGMSAADLGEQLHTTGSTISKHRRNNRVLYGRYKITRKKAR